ncbi:flavin reductase family protein [Aphanothece sacrum]|uniref:DeoR family transcriptional regulator n=1 Tax=Aphanothece sacrum FPU1 TaxID=1920663 RepID=A0A401ILH1_APHSA|nr:flavin reductase family protein [Aphanothece sacrum]GBF82087.1 DeoR family transcriptional regulator [Aphanothece sacrum FPU1]GBF85021.1 DeoR family transcriptional regulator [Aphanothece sacrum FPU3]
MVALINVEVAEPDEIKEGINLLENKLKDGLPILKDALACLKCQLSERMEFEDHWLIYGI